MIDFDSLAGDSNQSPSQQSSPASFDNLVNDHVTEKLTSAIAQQESGHIKDEDKRYTVLGPETRYGRAIGKYQVLAANVPQWSKEALGKSITPAEFRNSPELQDKIAQFKIGQLYDKYGNPGDVASVWHSGRPLKNNTAYDAAAGISTQDYARNVVSHFNGSAGKPSSTLPAIASSAPQSSPVAASPIPTSWDKQSATPKNLDNAPAPTPDPLTNQFSMQPALHSLVQPQQQMMLPNTNYSTPPNLSAMPGAL